MTATGNSRLVLIDFFSFETHRPFITIITISKNEASVHMMLNSAASPSAAKGTVK